MSGTNGLRIYKDAVAIVTGGASGIGRALGEGLAQRGARVVLADLQRELAEEVANGIRARGGKADAIHLDVTDYAGVESLVQETAKSHGRLDYMFNNAGIGIGGEVRHYLIQDWNMIFDVNIRGVVNGVQAAYQLMLQQGFGHIVNTASMAGLSPTPFIVGYATTKHAVVGLSTSLRVEAEDAGVRVSVLCPGVIRTGILMDGGKYGKNIQDIPPEKQQALWEKLRPMDPNLFAEKALRAVARNQAIIIFPGVWRLAWWLCRLSPALGFIFARQMLKETRKSIEG